MTDEHKTGQRVGDEDLWSMEHDAEVNSFACSRHLSILVKAYRDVCASEARLTEQLAAKDAEIERLTVEEKGWSNNAWEMRRLHNEQEARAERAEADLKAARTVDDEKVYEAQKAYNKAIWGSSISPIRAALTAALSIGQVGEETKDSRSPRDVLTEMLCGMMAVANDANELTNEEHKSLCRALNAAAEALHPLPDQPPQSQDQACGGDESDALAIKERLAEEEMYRTEAVRNADDEDGPGIMPGDVEGSFSRIRACLARRASQPSDAVAAVERLREDWYQNGFPERADQALRLILDKLRTLPSVPEPPQAPVAWQWRLKGQDDRFWLPCASRSNPKEPPKFDADRIEVRPLYAAPPSPKASR